MELAEADRLTSEALAAQEAEIADGFTIPNLALGRLATELPAPELRALVARLRSGPTPERQLAARLLKESSLSPDEALAEARSALVEETEPDVIGWLVNALGYTRSRSALPDLHELASHDSPEVRFQVPDALSMCAKGAFDQVADALLDLSQDEDDDVRWSAIYELAAWWPDTDDERVRARLADAAASDGVPTIRAVAADALTHSRN